VRILAYCDWRYLAATRRVVGEGKETMIVSSPPLFASHILPEFLEGYDLLYLDLHGLPQSGFLYTQTYNKAGDFALNFQTVRRADLDGTVVVATTCYLPETPFVNAFLHAGAAAVIGGSGANYGSRRRLSGAQALAKHVIRNLQRDVAPAAALGRAKKRLRRDKRRMILERTATKDALAFKLFTKQESEKRSL